MARSGLESYPCGMDRDRQNAMRLRAFEAMSSALAAAHARAPSLEVFIEDAMDSIELVRRDSTLAPLDRRILVDDMLRLVGALRKLVRAAPSARPELILEVGGRTTGLLRRYTRFVRP